MPSDPAITIDVFAKTKQADADLRNFANGLKGLGTVAASTGTKMRTSDKSYDKVNKSLKKLNATLVRTNTGLGKLGRRVKDTGSKSTRASKGLSLAALGFGRVATFAGPAAVGIIAVGAAMVALRAGISTIRQMISVNREYEETMASVKAVTEGASGFTVKAFKDMQAEARRLGATTRFSASEAAEGLKFLGMAGFEAEEATASLEATLKLAQAGALGLGEAADIVSNIMTAFGASAERTEEFADALAATASRSNTDIRQLGDAMKFIGPIAGGLGRSVKEVSAAMGTLGNAGVQSSMAGTALRGVMIQLADSNSKAHRELLKMGLTAEQINPSQNKLVDVFAAMAEKGVNASNAYSLFGARAGVAAEQLTRNIAKFREMNEVTENSRGTVTRMADTMDNTLNGALLRVRSAWQELLLQFGDGGIVDVMRDLTEGVAALLTQINQSGAITDLARDISNNFRMLGAVFGAVSVKGEGTANALRGINKVLGAMIVFITPIGKLVAALRALTKLSGIASQGNMGRAMQAHTEFLDSAGDKARSAKTAEDINAINTTITARLAALDKERLAIERNGNITKRQKQAELAQNAQFVKNVHGVTADLTQWAQTSAQAASASAKQAVTAEKIADETLKAVDAEIKRSETMGETLAKWDKLVKLKGIDAKFGGLGQAKAKLAAVLDIEGVTGEEEVQGQIDALREKIKNGMEASPTKGGKRGFINEDDEKKLKALLALADKLRELRRATLADAQKQANAFASKSGAEKALKIEEQIMQAKLDGNKTAQAYWERELAIKEKVAALESKGVADAEARATKLVDGQARLDSEQGKEVAQKKVMKGAFASAIDRVMGRSASDMVAKESAKHTKQNEEIRKQLEKQTQLAEEAARQAPNGLFA